MRKVTPFLFFSSFSLILLFVFGLFSQPTVTEAAVIVDDVPITEAFVSVIDEGKETAVQADTSFPILPVAVDLADVPTVADKVDTMTARQLSNETIEEQTQILLSQPESAFRQDKASPLLPNPNIQDITAAPAIAPTPSVAFDSLDITECCGTPTIFITPPDPHMAAGPNHLIASVNRAFEIYDKSGTTLVAPTTLPDFFAPLGGNCSTGGSNPNIIFDEEADRWIITDSAGLTCIGVSQTADPTGSYWLYEVSGTPVFGTHTGVGDSYIVIGSSTGVTALDKSVMYAGGALTPVFASLGGDLNPQPLHLHGYNQGTWPSYGNIHYFVTDPDDGCNISIWQWDIPSAPVVLSTIDLCTATNVPASPPVDFPQQGGLDIQAFHWRVRGFEYRNGSGWVANSMSCDLGSGTVDCVRWQEIDLTMNPPVLAQAGVFASADEFRTFPDLAVNACDDMAVGYTKSNSMMFPSIWYTGRQSSDPPGTLQAEAELKAGETTYSQVGSLRLWGYYTSMAIDPDGLTFWYMGEYAKSGLVAPSNWGTYIGAFSYECNQLDFTLNATPNSLDICLPNDAVYNIAVGSQGGFNGVVDLEAMNVPTGYMPTFSMDNQPAPYTSTLTIGNTGAAPAGNYNIDVVGMGLTSTHTTTVQLNLVDGLPISPTLVLPTDGANDVGLMPTFEWTAVADASSYYLEIATDPTFNNLVYTATIAAPTTMHTLGSNLDGDTLYYWRVTSSNICGAGIPSSVFTFSTLFIFCSNPNLPINDGPHTDDLIITTTGLLADEDVSLDITHSWVGDLIVKLEHLDTGTTLTLVDQPGFPNIDPTYGCNDNDLADFILDDESANGPHDDACPNTEATPAYPAGSDWDPLEAGLSVFDGEDLSGTWRLSITDVFPTADDGILNQWCIIPTVMALAPAIAVNPDSLSSEQFPNTQVTQTLSINNTGNSDLEWDIFEDGTVATACDSVDPINWVAVLPTSGTIPATLAENVTVTFDATGYDAGVYTGILCINSNDAANPLISVPLTMTILLNQVPVVNSDVYTTTKDMVMSVAVPGVLGNDSDGDSDELTAVLDTSPNNGTLSLGGDGSFTYTPTLGFEGSDSFTYYATDGIDISSVATVTIMVLNTAPVAVSDIYSTTEDVPLVVAAPGVLANDSDGDGDGLTAVLDTNVTSGALSFNMDGSFIYTPTMGFTGTDNFTYHINDGSDDSNGVAVTITVMALPHVEIYLPLIMSP